MTANECCRCREMHECPERNADWHWTNDAHTEARKGRFTVSWSVRYETWDVRHDDFPSAITTSNNNAQNGWAWICEDVLKSFTTWQSAQAPTLTPLPIPEVGVYISATLRDGRVVEGEVAHVNASDGCAALSVGGVFVTINRTESVEKHAAMPADIIAWHPIARPVPSEPTAFGAQVEAGGFRFLRSPGASITDRYWVNERGVWTTWVSICARGPVTVLSEGVEL